MRRQQGFTLLEIMVVVVIMGFAMAGAVIKITTNSPVDTVEKEAQRFYQLINLLQEEAWMTGNTYGLIVEQEKYSFYKLERNQGASLSESSVSTSDDEDAAPESMWVPIEGDSFFQEKKLPEEVFANLKIEPKEDSLFSWDSIFDKEPGQDDTDVLTPQIFYSAAGEPHTIYNVTFMIRTDTRDISYIVKSAFDGYLEIEGPLYE
jgi:general secretion pathway protein H